MKRLNVKRFKITSLVIVALAVSIVGLTLMHSSYAATASLTLSPSSGSYTVGNAFYIDLVESGGAATTLQAVVQFSSNLQFVSDTTVAPFSFNPPPANDTASGNSVTIDRSYFGGSSTGTVTTLKFIAQSPGTATVSFAASPNSYILPPGCTSSVTSCNILTSSPSASYTLSQPASPAPVTPPSSSNSAPSNPAPIPAGTPVTTNPKSTSVSIAPTGTSGSSSGNSSSSGGSVTAPNNSTVTVGTPVTVQPASVQTTGIQKVEYYLNNKLVGTETQAPYSYGVNTKKLKDGKYTLVSKTFYSDGLIKQASQHLVVTNGLKNSSSLTWVIALIVVLALLVFLGRGLLGPGGNPFNRLFNIHKPTSNVDLDYRGLPNTGSTPPTPPSSVITPGSHSQPTKIDIKSSSSSSNQPVPGVVIHPHNQV